jgi:hypothetical protein
MSQPRLSPWNVLHALESVEPRLLETDVSEQHTASFRIKCMFLRNVDIYLQVHKTNADMYAEACLSRSCGHERNTSL